MVPPCAPPCERPEMTWTKPNLQDLMARFDVTYPEVRCALDHQDPFQLVVATILSAQCTDARVNLTTPALFARYPDPAHLGAADLTELEGMIRSTGFFHNKARNLIGLGQALMARHDGQVPSDLASLANLPGVGKKTANVVLANAFGVPAFAVDTHVFRVARRLGLSEGNTPEKVEADLCRAFPEDRWIRLHHQVIWHGRRVCHARKPACAECPIASLCPTGSGRMDDPHTEAPVSKASEPRIDPTERIASGPERVVSLVPSFTELMAQWGLAGRLVGRTRYCVEPSWLRSSVATVGGTKDPDLERIFALKPDLVLMERMENTKETAEALAQAGIPMLVLDLRRVQDILDGWTRLGTVFGVPDLASERVKAVKALLKRPTSKAPRTLMLVWREPWIAVGTDVYLADMLRRTGHQPIGGEGYPRLADFELQALDPDVVILPTDPFPWKPKHAKELQALLPKAQVHILEGRAITWALSRTEEGLKLLLQR